MAQIAFLFLQWHIDNIELRHSYNLITEYNAQRCNVACYITYTKIYFVAYVILLSKDSLDVFFFALWCVINGILISLRKQYGS